MQVPETIADGMAVITHSGMPEQKWVNPVMLPIERIATMNVSIKHPTDITVISGCGTDSLAERDRG